VALSKSDAVLGLNQILAKKKLAPRQRKLAVAAPAVSHTCQKPRNNGQNTCPISRRAGVYK
jgi:hypothetical protein